MREPKLFDVTVLPTGLVTDPADPVESPTHIATVRPLAFAWYAEGTVHIDTVDKCDAEDLALRSLSALLSLIPAEQVVQAMGEETKDSIRMALLQEEEQEIAELKENRNAWHQRAIQAEASYRQAIARAEKAEAEAAASWQFAELARVKAKEAGDRAFRASERANSAELERDAMHAAAEELRAQGAVLPEAHSGSPSGCRLCHGVGWAQLFGEPRKPCKACNGTGRKTEESDGREQHVVASVAAASPDSVAHVPLTRPPCIPSHIADADWTMIEGRAVWRHRDLCYIAHKIPNRTSWAWDMQASAADYSNYGEDFRADVPESLFIAARRWMGWEKKGSTLTAVDLTELREAWKAVPDFQPHPITKPVRALFDAVEKLLSGGAL